MKKSLIFLLACLLLLPLGGCSKNNSENKDDPKVEEQANNNDKDNVSNQSGDDKDSDVIDDKDQDSKDNKEVEVIKPSKENESIICDNEYALIRLEEMNIDEDNSVSLKVYMENKTKERNLSVITWTSAINGVQIDPMFGDKLEPGKNKTETINIPTSYLEMCQIEKFTDISATFKVYDNDSGDEEALAEGVLKFYPYGEDKAEKFKLTMDPSYKVLMEQDDIQIWCVGSETNDTIGYFSMLYVQNDSDRCITVCVDSSTIDDVPADIFAYLEIEAGNVGFVELYWSDQSTIQYDDQGNPIDSDQEPIDPAKAKDIKVELSVYDTEDWEGPHIFFETVDIK